MLVYRNKTINRNKSDSMSVYKGTANTVNINGNHLNYTAKIDPNKPDDLEKIINPKSKSMITVVKK